MNVQVDLFGIPIREVPNFIWSYSRREVLEQCPRKYYYHYYGSSSRTAETERDKEALKFLKKLSNRHMRIGKIFHLIIRTYFTKLIEGETWELDRLLSWAKS
ncbi:MAG: PD-(D/E)XK nuclease family protein, partial [bacterium]